MSGSSGNTSVPNGTGNSALDPMQRLSSFKAPRDLSLGGPKPGKKVFTPNLNVSRNKNKSGLPTVTKDKRHDNDKGKRDRKNDRNKNTRNGPSIIKSSGVFSEGMGVTERRAGSRNSYGRDVEAAPTLQKPTIRVKDVWKIDKELEQQKINKVLGDSGLSDEETAQDDVTELDKDAPVRLPLSQGGWLQSKPKAIKVKTEVIVKEEPGELDGQTPPVDQKAKVDVKKEFSEDTDIVSLLQADKPTLIMLQFPDTLPGRGGKSEDDFQKKKKEDTSEPSNSSSNETENKPDERCRLSDLDEGRIGKLLVHRSGRVRLALGDTMFEVAAGTQAAFRQEVVSMAVDDDSRSANLISLGTIPHKFNLLPHWETMLANMTL